MRSKYHRARLSAAPRRLVVLAFFAALLLLYAAFSPFSTAGMGYVGEEVKACRQIREHSRSGTAIEWPRNGAMGLLVQCPFVTVGDVLGGATQRAEDLALSWQPMIATAALVTILFVWAARLAASREWGLTLSLAGGFATLLWPYAYIGLETTQSLFLLLAGFLALDRSAPRTWGRCLCFGVCAAFAIGVKSGGVLLVPACAFLAWRFFREPAARPAEGLRAKAVATLLLVVLLFAANAWVRGLAWVRFGGTAHFASLWLVRDPVSPLLNLLALLASPNKGLILYAPLTLLAVIALPRTSRAEPPVAVFAALVLAGLVGGLCLLGMWSDETWGPRYLHSAVAPLILCLAAARRDRALRLRREPALVLAVAIGLAVSFLGVAFYYGTLMGVATSATSPTLETLQSDMTWNHVRFNGRLLRVWLRTLRGAAYPQYLPAGWFWSFQRLEQPPSWKRVDLTPYAHPQPVLMRALEPGSPARRAASALTVALAAGIGLIVFVRRAA
jgi:hypothetical protein